VQFRAGSMTNYVGAIIGIPVIAALAIVAARRRAPYLKPRRDG
jgi:hypothetical protein